MTDPAQNKANVIAFYELMFNDCQPREAIERYVGDEYIQAQTRMWRPARTASSPISSAWRVSGRASGSR